MKSEVVRFVANLKHALRSCWSDTGATPELASAYRIRQFDHVAREQPWAVLGNGVGSALIVTLFWDVSPRAILVWLVLAWMILVSSAHFGFRRMAGPKDAPAPAGFARVLALRIGSVGLLFGLMLGYLFGLVDDTGRIVLTALAATFTALGTLQFAALIVAAAAWLISLCFGIAVSLLVFSGTTYLYVLGLLGLLTFYTLGAALLYSKRFLSLLQAEHESQHQREMVTLLLNDFESDAQDWLWETDRQGLLLRVPQRLATSLGAKATHLARTPFVEVMRLLSSDPTEQEPQCFGQLEAALLGSAAFRCQPVQLTLEGRREWWAVAGKPLIDQKGSHVGWRGVGQDVTHARQRERDLARLANQDTLTGLANRHRFNKELAAYFDEQRVVTPCTLLLLDLDNFKAVNDALGHGAGDRLLIEVARRLSEVVGPGELLARLGGDEFVVIIPSVLGESEGQLMGNYLLGALSRPWDLDNYRVTIQASIGIAFAPQDATTPENLLRMADLALYAAKDAGRNSVLLFKAGMSDQAQRKLAVLQDMVESLQRGEFHCVYQPQIDFQTGLVTGFEALVRWHHPTLGVISPTTFVPIAEESGLILKLGEWVMRKACQEAARWPQGLKVAVNVSAIQFASANVLGLIDSALRASGLPPQRLEVEITESSLMKEPANTMAALQALRQRGIQVVLDDFGTGYSSLAYLRRFPLDKLKIDRSFVIPLGGKTATSTPLETPDMVSADARAVVAAIIQLAQALGLQTTAEGVETSMQWETLQTMGCGQAQGYLVSEPMAQDDIDAFLQTWACEVI